MTRALLVSASDLAAELGGTVLFRSSVERLRAGGVADVRRAAETARLDVVVVDSAMPAPASIVAALRQDLLTRHCAIVVLGRTEFGSDHLAMLEAGANAILPLPAGHDWDDRLVRLMHVPVRKSTRFPVDLALEGGLRRGVGFSGRALDLSVHGLLLECRHPLDVGEDLRLAFALPGGEGGVRGTGTVVRLAPGARFGVELTHVEGDGRVRIKRYVEGGAAG